MTQAQESRGLSGTRANLPVLLLDGDDTLWETEPLYDAARERAAAVVREAGLNAERWSELQRKIDLGNVARLGFSPARFPASSVAAYEALAAESGTAVDCRFVDRIREASASVFHDPAPVFDGAREVLESLRPHYRLVLLTKGDDAVQRRRIAHSGLAELFDEVHIVAVKNPDTVRQLLRSLGADPATSWSVGNSVPSDVQPALEVGLHAVWIDRHVWAHEHHDAPIKSDRLFVADDLRELPALLARLAS